jgi:hypothetical protein
MEEDWTFLARRKGKEQPNPRAPDAKLETTVGEITPLAVPESDNDFETAP